MGKSDRLLLQALHDLYDTDIGFYELCALLKRLGFEMSARGSHHVFTLDGIFEQINLQKDGAKAKPYQVKQVLVLITKYKLGKEF